MNEIGSAARPGGETSPERGGAGSPPPAAASGPIVAASAVAVRALLAYRAHQARTARCGARPQTRIDDAIERGMLALARRQTPDGRLNHDLVASAIVLWQLGREPAFVDAGADVENLRRLVRREASRPGDAWSESAGPQATGPQATGPQAGRPQTKGPQTKRPQTTRPQTKRPQTKRAQTSPDVTPAFARLAG